MDKFITLWFPIILTIIGISTSAAIAYLFKYKWRPKIEDIFEENVYYTIDLLFEKINKLDKQYDWFTNMIKENKAVTSRNEYCYNFGKGVLDEIENNRDYLEKYMAGQFFNYTLNYVVKTVNIMQFAKSNEDVQTDSESRMQ